MVAGEERPPRRPRHPRAKAARRQAHDPVHQKPAQRQYRAEQQELRQKLIEAKAVDVMVAVGPNMFYTVTLPCTLWFLDRGKASSLPRPRGGEGRGEGQTVPTRFYSSMRDISIAKSIARTATGRPHRLGSLPTWSACIAAKSPT
jgi:hypothetical protein